MKEPELEADGDGAGESVSRRRPVAGSKALARLMDFQARRGAAKVDVLPTATMAKVEPGQLMTSTSRLSRGSVTVAGLDPEPRPGGAETSLYLAAFKQQAAVPNARLAPASRVARGWQPLGPFSIPHGQSYGTGAGSRPPVSGRVSSVAVDPGNPEHVLIGAGGGGVWESFDRGETWQPRTDDQPSLSIGALAFDPSDPDLVYAGTGEGDTLSWLGVGLLRSSDGGTSWHLHAEQPFQGLSFFDLVVDPLDGQRLFAATSDGIFESSDGGATWRRRRSVITWSLSLQPVDPDAADDPEAEREILAGCKDGIFRAVVGSSSWLRTTIPVLPSTLDRVEVCHAPSDRDVAYVFAAGAPDTDGSPTAYVLRRAAAGANFVVVTPPEDLKTSQSWYDWHAAVAPDDAEVLYLGSINLHKGRREAGGGWTWQNLSARHDAPSIHPDQHALAFDPFDPSTLYAANDGGLYASRDAGASWRSLNKGLSITEFQFLAQHRDFDAWLIGGTQDNGTVRYEGLGLWHHVQDGDGGDCGASQSDPYTCFHTFYGMGTERSTTGGGWGSWKWVGPSVATSQNYPAGALFYPPLEVEDSLVIQAGVTLHISSELGEPGTWRKINLPETAGRASTLAIVGADLFYVGTEKGHVYRVERLSGSWRKPVPLTFPTSGFLSDLLVDPSDPERLWATCSSLHQPGVFRSDDGGASWHALSDGLPRIPINSIVLDPTSPDSVFVAADVGVHRSFDAGRTWAPFSEGLPNALVKDLVFHGPSRLLRAATQSRGVWEIAVDQETQPEVQLYLRDSVVDTGRRVPSPSGVEDPFEPGKRANWWHCPDLKIDPAPFDTARLGDVDFVVFGDDRTLEHGGVSFADGLRHQSPKRGEEARVYAQVHNRGIRAAENVSVRLFAASFDQVLPRLADDFWTGFPDNTPAPDDPWQPIAPARTLETLEAGRSQVAGFLWDVPNDAAGTVALLVAVSADNDELDTGGETRVSILVPGEPKCGLKLVEVED